MAEAIGNQSSGKGPKKQKKRYSYDESADEPATLIDNESTEVEREIPANESEPIQNIEAADKSKPPLLKNNKQPTDLESSIRGINFDRGED